MIRTMVTDWTKEPPTEAGFYFYRHSVRTDLEVRRVPDECNYVGHESLWWPERIKEPPTGDTKP